MSQIGCIKCSNQEVAVKAIGMGENGIGTLFDRQQKEVAAVSCINCGYTEIYTHKVDNEEEIKRLFFQR